VIFLPNSVVSVIVGGNITFVPQNFFCWEEILIPERNIPPSKISKPDRQSGREVMNIIIRERERGREGERERGEGLT
jgi:hypothetical protein